LRSLASFFEKHEHTEHSEVIRRSVLFRERMVMNLQNTIRDAIVSELERQAEVGDPPLKVDTSDPGYAVLEGRIDLDALIMLSCLLS
jgi:hypothetical protein